MTKFTTRIAAVLAVLATICVGVSALSPSASAYLYGANPDFTMTPTYGPAGTVITVSGHCNFTWSTGSPTMPSSVTGSGATQIFVALVQSTGFIASDLEVLPNTSNESWTATMTVPTSAAVGSSTVGARCLRSDNTPSGDAPFNTQTFAVTAPPATAQFSLSTNTPVVDSTTTTITATLDGSRDTPTGTVVFNASNGQTHTWYAAYGGSPTFAINATPPTTIHVTAHYSGDLNYSAADASLDVPFVLATTATSATVTPASPVPYGQTVTVAGSVAFTNVTDPAKHPAGTVSVLRRGATVAVANLAAATADQGTFSVALPQQAVGSEPLTVQFNPANPALVTTSTTAVGPLIVAPSTSTTVTPSTNPTVPGQAATFTSTVTAIAPATGTPTGSVAFAVDGSWIGVATLDANGRATSPLVSDLTNGQHLVAAVYFGDGATLSPSVGYAIQVVAPRTAHLNATSVLASYPTLHATLTANGAPLAGRTVTFTTPAGSVLCTATTASSGSASCGQWTQAFLAFGYQVHFAGDAADTPATASVGW